ncbi:MAG: ATP-binding cassette domain-containing protein, partial [Coprobacillus sp.]|nr:ATP-binding cassette domain-containing protein [Coprobacillus sp.]
MLEIKNLTKSFDRPLFKNMTMSFQKKGMYVIMGQSGCGKSTLLNMLGGLDQQYQGTIEVDGKDIRKIPHYIRRYVGFIFQQFHLVENMSVRENESLVTYFKKIIVAKKEIYLKRLKIKELQRYKASILSGGQKQRLCIARALLKNPKILILDDSTSAVDTVTDAKIRKAFREEIPDTTKIIIAQRISSVQDADRIIVMDDGKINEIGTHDYLKD